MSQMIKIAALSYCALAFAAIGYLAFFRVDGAWLYSEGALWSLQYILNEDFSRVDTSFHLINDLKRIFWFESRLDGGQFRLVTALFQLVDTRLRAALFSVVPPHASLSLTWLIALILIPALVHKILKNLFPDLNPLERAVCIISFLFSGAALSAVLQYYHPGKILAVLAFALALVMSSWVLQSPNESWSRTKRLCTLGAALFAGLFIDFYCFVNFCAVVVLYPQLVGWSSESATVRENCASVLKNSFAGLTFRRFNYVSVMLLSVGLYVLTAKLFLPWLSGSLGERVEFLQHIEIGYARALPFANLASLKFFLLQLPNIYLQLGYSLGLLATEERSWGLPYFLTPYDWKFLGYWASWGVTSLVTVLFCGALAWAFFKRNKDFLVVRIAALFFSTLMLSSLVHSYTDIILPHGTYFYGALMAIPLSLLYGLLLSSFRVGGKARKVLLTALIILSGFSLVSGYYMNLRFIKLRGGVDDVVTMKEGVRFQWRWAKDRKERTGTAGDDYCRVPDSFAALMRTEPRLKEQGAFSTLHTVVRDQYHYRYLFLAGLCS